ncbi:MAG: Rab family GTPase [Candidatus Heimdallarchaeaceae archaeon]
MEHGFKILIIGLPEAGKSSLIQALIEGIKTEQLKQECKDFYQNEQRIDIYGCTLQAFDVGKNISLFDDIFSTLQVMAFSNIKALIFVVDITRQEKFETASILFKNAYKTVRGITTEPRFYIFAHKIDLLTKEELDEALKLLSNYFNIEEENIDLFATTVCNNDIYDIMRYILTA